MRSKKILHIKECYLNLPDDFNWTIGEALTLMANRAILAEQYHEEERRISYNAYEDFLKSKKKCAIAYEFLEEKINV